MQKRKSIIFILHACLFSIFLSLLQPFIVVRINPLSQSGVVHADTLVDEEDDDLAAYEKYKKYLAYDKRGKYRKYKKYKEKYGFENSKEKAFYKELYELYKQYKKNPQKYRQYAKFQKEYDRYKKYKDKMDDVEGYEKYKKYDKAKYNRPIYKRYGKEKFKLAYNRYKAKLKNQQKNKAIVTDADLAAGPLGPEIAVGLWSYSAKDLAADDFRITANKAYTIKDRAGNAIAVVEGSTTTRVRLNADKKYRVYNVGVDTILEKEVRFEAADGNNGDLVFDANKPSSEYDHYRGRISVRMSDTSTDTWVINTLPLEHYVWGMGEITATGPDEFSRLMTILFQTYGYWKIKYGTMNAAQGFKVSNGQVYTGYDWEVKYPKIRTAAEATRGILVMYSTRIALTPYSSWTDGRTRSWKEYWGSENYPWCVSVPDPYGKHPTMTTKELQDAGNHMVGLSAKGGLKLADEHGWNWEKILKYYYKDVTPHIAY